jgi:hypothetical protein
MQAELRKLDKKKTGITIEALKKFARTHQALLFPAFKLQHHLQTKVLGANFWERASGRRVELSAGKYIEMGELMRVVSAVCCGVIGCDVA